ncbi:hypothetical protein BKA64DRAFT_773431 [Cadophora sp. MPI-SDFR-AT-0126]|nr:hypothetical protein BKA64DRAFT_773431 [Leotiomycetes sp. MPI-SDFR-AT-0126]
MAASSRPNNMHGVMDLSSSLHAVLQSQMTCRIHEDCDGSCTGEQITFSPILSPTANARMTIAPRPREVPAGYIRQNAEWLGQQQLEDFVYNELPGSTPVIRLLTVKPAVFRDEVVECDLVDAALEDNPSYIALSYHWGPPNFDHTIIVNGRLISITKSLHTERRTEFEVCSMIVDLGSILSES